MGRISYLILGPLEVRDDETAIALSGGQQRKLLAILLLHGGEAVSSDRLVDELWHGEPPETAAKALQGYVSSLRKQLGQDKIETIGSAYRLSVAATDIDSHRFEQLLAEARPLERAPAAAKLHEALALWRGPALADFAYEDFAQHEIERLEELHLSGIERRIDLELALGHHDDLVPELETLVRTHPLRERLRGFLMIALYRSGRQADALNAYQDARRALNDDLGLEPNDELQGLQRAILAHDNSLTAPPRTHIPNAAEKHQPPESHRLRRPLLATATGLAILAAATAAITLGLGTSKAAPIVVPPNSVLRIDPGGLKVKSIQGVGRGPVAIAVGLGGVWVADAEDSTVTRLDPVTGKGMDTIGAGGGDLNDIAVGFGFVWVANGNDGTITKIDPHLGAGPPIKLGAQTLAPDPVFYIAIDSQYVWATRGNDLLRINPVTDKVEHRVNIGTPTGLATGGGSVWVTTESRLLWRINPQTLSKDPESLRALSQVVQAPVFGRGSLWLIAFPHVPRIDPTSLNPALLPVPSGLQPRALAWGSGSLWSIGNGGRLTRLATASQPAEHLYIGGNLSAVAAGEGAIWVAVSATN